MEKFEYCIFDDTGYDDNPRDEFINNLGKDGWELVSVILKVKLKVYFKDECLYYFKRILIK